MQPPHIWDRMSLIGLVADYKFLNVLDYLFKLFGHDAARRAIFLDPCADRDVDLESLRDVLILLLQFLVRNSPRVVLPCELVHERVVTIRNVGPSPCHSR